MRHQLLAGALGLRWTGEVPLRKDTHTQAHKPGNEYVNHMMAISIPVSDPNRTLYNIYMAPKLRIWTFKSHFSNCGLENYWIYYFIIWN